MTSSSEQTTALIAQTRKWAERNGVSIPSDYIFELATRLEDATDMLDQYQTVMANQANALPTMVAELHALRAGRDKLLTLVQPILDRSEGQIGTHSDKCFEYHVACLAAVVRHRLGGTE